MGTQDTVVESSGLPEASKMLGLELGLIDFVKRFEAFRFQNAEVGHAHTGKIVDIPFPRSVRDALLAEGLAQAYHGVLSSGWITFRLRNEQSSSMPAGSCGCHTSGICGRPQLICANSLSEKQNNCT